MNSRIWFSALLIVLTKGALAQDCVLVVCGKDDYCEVTPARVVASLPAGLEIRSIRGNTKVAMRGEAATADCKPSGRLQNIVSADRASLYGAIQVSGTLRVKGILRFEPNDGGVLEFRPTKDAFRGNGKFFNANFERIKLDEAQPPVRVAPPSSLAKADCWQASATAELSDFSVLIGDSSSAGSYARRAQVTGVHGFVKCKWGGE